MNRAKVEELIGRMRAEQETSPELLASVTESLTVTDNVDPLYREFFGDFYDEAKGFTQKVSSYLAEFRGGVYNSVSISESFRLSHMVKGAAATMGYRLISTLAAGMESLFVDVKDGKRKLSSNIVDQLQTLLSLIEEHLEELKQAN